MHTFPLVSVIIPTTADRQEFNANIEGLYSCQDYPNKELLLDYGPETIGEKRNNLCALAKGEIICHMDSDDLYKHDWISKSVDYLTKTGADVVGLSAFEMYDTETGIYWRYAYTGDERPWLAGATMVYKRSHWERSPFPKVSSGEDAYFCYGRNGLVPIVAAHPYIAGFLSLLHKGNTSSKLKCKRWKRLESPEKEIVNNRWLTIVPQILPQEL